MARPKGSERRKQRLHSIATASSDSIHPPPEQTQPVPSEGPFEFTTPFPTARCPGSYKSSASSASSSSCSSTEAEVEVEFKREDVDINTFSSSNDLTLVRQGTTIESSRHVEPIVAPSLFYVFLNAQGALPSTHLEHLLWKSFNIGQDPRNWWCEPREINMHSKMTPETLPSTDLAPGQRSSDLKSWEAGFDFRLFARSLRLFPDQKPKFVPYILSGTRASYQAYHDPPNTWRRRKDAADTLDEILSSDLSNVSDPLTLENVAKKAFDGMDIPENFPLADFLSAAPEEVKKFVISKKKTTFWSRVLANKLLETKSLSVFLIDLIMANQMENACENNVKYYENRVRRHRTYDETVKSLGIELPTSTHLTTVEESDGEATPPKNDDAPEIGSEIDTPEFVTLTPGPSKKKKNKKKNQNTIKNTNTPTSNINGGSPAPDVTPQNDRETARGAAASPISDQDEDSPPPKLLPEAENLPKLSDRTETDFNDEEWNVVETKATQRNKKGKARGSVYGIFPDVPNSTDKAQQTPPRPIPPQTSSATPWRKKQPKSTIQNRPQPSASTASPISPGKLGQSSTVKKPSPWSVQPAAKDATSRVVNAIDYPSMPSTPKASGPPASRTDSLGASKKESQSKSTGKCPDESTSARAPSIERGSNTKTSAPSTSHRTPSSKDTQKTSERAPFEEQSPTLTNHKVSSMPLRSPLGSEISKETPSGRAPSEEQMQTPVTEKSKASTLDRSRSKASRGSSPGRTPSREPPQPSVAPNPKAPALHRSPTRSNRPGESSSSGGASLKDRVQAPVAKKFSSPTPHQSTRSRSPKKFKLSKAPPEDAALASKGSTAPTSTTYDKNDKQAPGSLPEADERDLMVLASEIQPEESKARPPNNFQSKSEIKVEKSRSTTVPKTPNNRISASQEARNTSSATPDLSTHALIADGGKPTEPKQQTPKSSKPTPTKLPVDYKVVPAITSIPGISKNAYSNVNTSRKGAARADTTAGPSKIKDDHIKGSQPAVGEALHSNDSTPRTISGSPFHHKHTQSLPGNQSLKMGAEALDPTRPAFVGSSPNNALDPPGPPDRSSPTPRVVSSSMVKKTPESDQRKSHSRQTLAGGQMKYQPEGFGQNNYGTTPHGTNNYGPNSYGANHYAANHYANHYGANHYGTNHYGMNYYGTNHYGTDHYGNQYGPNPCGPNPHGPNLHGMDPYGVNAYGTNPHWTNFYANPCGPPAAPHPTTMDPTLFGPPQPPSQQNASYTSRNPQDPTYAMNHEHLGPQGYTTPPVNPAMNTFGNNSNTGPPANAPKGPKKTHIVPVKYHQSEEYHNSDHKTSEISGACDNGLNKGAKVDWQEAKSEKYNEADSLPRTPHDEQKAIADDNIPKVKPTGTAANNAASGSPKVDLDKTAQVEVIQGSQVDGHGGNDDVESKPQVVKVDDAPPEVAPLQIESNNPDIAADDPGQQLDSRPENPPSNDGDRQQEYNLEGTDLLNNLSSPQKSNGTSLEPLSNAESNGESNTQSNGEDSTKASMRLKYPGTFCTFCNSELSTNPAGPLCILCSGCGPRSNIRYCSEACIMGDAYDHRVHCQMYPWWQSRHGDNLPPLGHHLFKDPLMPMEASNDSPEKFRQKTFMMYCTGNSYPRILKAWGRREFNKIPEGVDVNESGKQIGSYFIFRSTKTAPLGDPDKVFLSGKNLSVNRFNHNADVIFAITLPKGSTEKIFLSRALNCCFLSEYEPIKESLYRLIRHFIVDEQEFNRLKVEEPLDVVFAEFQHQFTKEFNFNAAAIPSEHAGYTLKSLINKEWKRCGSAIEGLEERNPILSNWRTLS